MSTMRIVARTVRLAMATWSTGTPAGSAVLATT